MSNKKHLTKNQIELITVLASEVAIKQFKAEITKHKKQEKDWRLRNTKLLLTNYRRLKAHVEDIENQIDEYENTIFNLEELTLETLMKYKLKTAKMMRHFERMLAHFEYDCTRGTDEDRRRYKVIYYRYLSPEKMTISQLCELFNVEKGTIYRDTKIAINDLSVLLFGVASIESIGFKQD